MFEKVNPGHPDKVADRIAGAMVDLAYRRSDRPKVAVEVLLGHEDVYVIAEGSESYSVEDVLSIVDRIAGEGLTLYLTVVDQDRSLAKNQDSEIRCGDNGIFKGSPVTDEQKVLTNVAKSLYKQYNSDGKYLISDDLVIICQSKAKSKKLKNRVKALMPEYDVTVNPLGYWTGGPDVDCGATNRKLGSDMGNAITGGGLHGKDLSKADVSVNIYAHLLAQSYGEDVYMSCAIGDKEVISTMYSNRELKGYVVSNPAKIRIPFAEIVAVSRDYIDYIGGFEKLAEWGLIR